MVRRTVRCVSTAPHFFFCRIASSTARCTVQHRFQHSPRIRRTFFFADRTAGRCLFRNPHQSPRYVSEAIAPSAPFRHARRFAFFVIVFAATRDQIEAEQNHHRVFAVRRVRKSLMADAPMRRSSWYSGQFDGSRWLEHRAHVRSAAQAGCRATMADCCVAFRRLPASLPICQTRARDTPQP